MRLNFKKSALVTILGFDHDPPEPSSTVNTCLALRTRLQPKPPEPFENFAALFKDALQHTYCAVQEIDPAEPFTAFETAFSCKAGQVKFEFSAPKSSPAFFDFFRHFCAQAGQDMDTMVTDNYCSIRAGMPTPIINLLGEYLRRDISGRGLMCLDDTGVIDKKYLDAALFAQAGHSEKVLAAYFPTLPVQAFNSVAEAAFAAESLDLNALPFSLKHMCASLLESDGPFPETLRAFRLH